MTKLPKDFGRIKMEEEMLRQDTKRRTEKRHADDKMHPVSVASILVGIAALVALCFWAGTIVDAFIGVIGM